MPLVARPTPWSSLDELGGCAAELLEEESRTVYGQLRQWVVGGVFSPGMRLSERELAQRLAVSRSPVRDALWRMHGEGLVSFQVRGGVHVRTLRPGEGRELAETISLLEAQAAGHAARVGDQIDLHLIQSAVEDMAEVGSATANLEPAAARKAETEADVRFHLAVANAAHNEFLRQEILRLYRIRRAAAGGAPSIVIAAADEWRTHAAILEAIEHGDATAANTAMAAHCRAALGVDEEHGTRETPRPKGSDLRRSG